MGTSYPHPGCDDRVDTVFGSKIAEDVSETCCCTPVVPEVVEKILDLVSC